MSLHVNYELRWKNYRAFQDTGWIVLKPLTIIIGPNNSGKSSIVSPLLLMDQTMSSREATAPLVTRGPNVDLGFYKDIVHNGDLSREMSFGFRFHPHVQTRKKLGKLGTYPPGAIEVSVSSDKQSEEPVLTRFELQDVHNRPLFSQTLKKDGKYSFASDWIKLQGRELEAAQTSKPLNFLFTPGRAIRATQVKDDLEKKIEVNFSKPFSMYLTALGMMNEELRYVLSDLAYIGPLRDRPRRYYEVSNDMPASVGSHGEHMANLLRRQMPTIQTKLNHWVKQFDFGRELKLRNLSDGQLFSLFFVDSTGSRVTNIADSGFGASQVLPLIVQALTAPTRSLTIAEQPEIHLNPRLQYALADLFVEMANNDQRVIVETHSEHLLLRLRRLIANQQIKPQDVALYFVEKKDGISTIQNIPLESDGKIQPNAWPKGFFEDSLRESLALASVQSQRAKKLAKSPVAR